MAPKKQKAKSKTAPKSKSHHATDAKPAPKLQISAENERRLRRLLLNTDRPAAAPPPPAAPDTASRAQKAKRLRSVYDKLSLEGFTPDQIEQALSALNEAATFEAALDWLCLNIPGNELPLKFSSGASESTHEGAERSVKVLSTAREDWVPPQRTTDEVKEEIPGVAVRIKGRRDEMSLDFGKSSQADWIRQYMEQEEEEEQEEEVDPSSRLSSIAKEYQRARLGALEAKHKGDRKCQDHFSDVIYKLKQELSSLGLSDDTLNFFNESADSTSEELPCFFLESKAPDDTCCQTDFAALAEEPIIGTDVAASSRLRHTESAVDVSDNSVVEAGEKSEEPENLELDNLFCEEPSSSGVLPPEIVKHQKKEKSPQFAYGHAIGNIDDIWKKGDSGRIPKAVLQKLCQRLGWEAPKYSKLFEKENKFLYAVSILRTAMGRGKSRKAGGLITLQLPYEDEAFGSAEQRLPLRMSERDSKKKKKAPEVLSWHQKKELADMEEESMAREVEELVSWTTMIEAMDDNRLKEHVLNRPESLQRRRSGKSVLGKTPRRGGKSRASSSSASQGLMAAIWKFHKDDEEETSVTFQV